MEKENDERRHCDECWSQPRLQWKWNPLSTALSPVFPQEKMEIANIEPTQSILLSRKELRGMLATTERGPTEGGVGESWSLSGFICPGWHAAPWQRCYSHSIVSEPSHSSHTPLFVSVVPLMSTSPPPMPPPLFLVLTYCLSPPLGFSFDACDSPTQAVASMHLLTLLICIRRNRRSCCLLL